MSLSDQVPDFSGVRVAVVGDLIIDHYLHGRPSRLSHEAPVIILQHVDEEFGVGGSGNVALNIHALGGRTRLVGAIGSHEAGAQLMEELERRDMRTGAILTAEGWTTPTKMRVLGAERQRTMQQMLRIDRDPDEPLDDSARAGICDNVRGLLGEIDALCISDYGYGTVGPELTEVAAEATQNGVVTVLDPRASLTYARGLTAIAPNLAELARATGHAVDDFEDPQTLAGAGRAVLEEKELKWLLVTMGNRGMGLFGRELPATGVFVEASGPDEIIDVSGAGDTAIATFTLALATGVSGPDAMRMANAAAGVVVMESGTALCTASKLRTALPEAPVPSVREPGEGS
jgi:rfaE bifunctional protein kinase chain/domain